MAEAPMAATCHPRIAPLVDQRSNLSKGDRRPDHWRGGITSGLRSRLRVQVRAQVRVRESGPEPVPEPENLNLIPDGRDLGPENDFMPAAFYPVSGLPLRLSRGRADRPGQPRLSEGAQTYPRQVFAVSGKEIKTKRAPVGALLISRVNVSPCPRDPRGVSRRAQ